VAPRAALRSLRWGSHGALHADEPPPASLGAIERWSTSAIGDHEAATVRAILALPDGTVALGSDYGLTLVRQGAFRPFPWPAGARREARRVETMAHHAGELVIGTSQALFIMDARGNVRSTRHPADDEGGQDELLALYATSGRLLQGWRTRLVGGRGPRDVLAMAQDPAGNVYAGTRSGEVVVVDGTPEGASLACIAQLGGERRRPVRHLAFARDALWAAAGGACHRFDGAAWTTVADIEPTAMTVDRAGRLWLLADGGLWSVDGPLGRETWLPWDVPVDRPWTVAAAEGALWVGGHGQLARIAMDA
jgi:ligand-binding sensor domain-containing protein